MESVAGYECGYTLKFSPGEFIALIGRFRFAYRTRSLKRFRMTDLFRRIGLQQRNRCVAISADDTPVFLFHACYLRKLIDPGKLLYQKYKSDARVRMVLSKGIAQMIRTEPVSWDRNTQGRSATTYSFDPVIAMAFLTQKYRT